MSKPDYQQSLARSSARISHKYIKKPTTNTQTNTDKKTGRRLSDLLTTAQQETLETLEQGVK